MNDLDPESVEFAGGGILGGKALDQQENLKFVKMGEDGYTVKVPCALCDKSYNVTPEWHELFLVGSNGAGRPLLLPPGWMFSQNNADAYFPGMCCSSDGKPSVCPHFTPEECRSLVNAAVQKGLIPRHTIEGWKANIARARGR